MNFNADFNINVNKQNMRFPIIQSGSPILTSLVSGSPIIQNGKLVGAAAHIFVNDPAKGYGIFIENILSEAS